MVEIRYHLDEHVPHAVAVGLRRRGIDVTTTVEQALMGASDVEQLAFATAQGRVLVTRDQDHLALARMNSAHAGIVFWHSKRDRLGPLVETLILLWQIAAAEQMTGQIEFV